MGVPKSEDKVPEKNKPIDLGDVFVIRVKDLRMNVEHVKCLLHGELLQPWAGSSREQPLFMNVIQDNGGDRMKLVVLLKGTRHIGLKDMNEWYPPGSRVCLKDPFFRVMSDGSVGIRVDDMNLFDTTVSYREIQESQDPAACPPEERFEALRSQGNALFKANDLDAALKKYEEALQVIEDSQDTAGEVASRLRREKAHLIHSNRAMCFLKKESYAAALEDADHSLELRPDFLKGYQRKVSALIGLDSRERRDEGCALLLDVLPKAVPEKEITKGENTQLSALLKSASGPFSNEVATAVEHLGDQRTWFYPDYFAMNAEHCSRLLQTVNFTAHQRRTLDMPDEEIDEIIEEEMGEELRQEKLDDLQQRQSYKKKIQDSASGQLVRVRSASATFVKTVRALMEKDDKEGKKYDEEKRELLNRLLRNVEPILDKGTVEGVSTESAGQAEFRWAGD